MVGSICFPDDPEKHTKILIDLLRHYDETGGGAGNVVVTVGIDGDDFIIKVMKGFDCLYLPLNEVKSLLDAHYESQVK